MPAGKLMLIDGNSILNRAFYALQGSRMLSTATGLYTNAVFGFVNILNKFMEEEKPEYICVAFDLKAPTFRHIEYSSYKAHRKGMPDELAAQVPVVKEVLDCMNICRIESEGYEADDIIGTISRKAEQKGIDCVIITGDRDALQLASRRTRVRIPTTRSGRTETEEYDDEGVFRKYGVTPSEFVEVKALMGDASDNIPGVPGIGEKTALELISRYKSLENIYDNIGSILKKAVADKLSSNKELAFMSRRIATIERDVPGICGMEDCKFNGFDRKRLYDAFRKLEFNSFIMKFKLDESVGGTGSRLTDKGIVHGTEVIKPDVLTQYEIAESVIKVDEGKNICITKEAEMASVRDAIINEGSFAIYPLIDKIGATGCILVGVGLYAAGCGQVYLDLSSQNASDSFLRIFKPIFLNPHIRICGHDLKPLCIYLLKQSIPLGSIAFDTMVAAYVLNPIKESYPIENLSEAYLNIRIESLVPAAAKSSQRQYACMMPENIAHLAAVYAKTASDLQPVMHDMLCGNEQEQLYYSVELPLVRVLAEMEHYGFKVDIDALNEYSAELGVRISALKTAIHAMAGEDFNINSPKQLAHILFEKLKLPALKKTKKGYSTDVEVLEQLAAGHEIIKSILEYRQLAKLKSTYAEGLLGLVDPATCRIHSSFNQTVTATGRISSTEPNLQNIPIRLELGRKIRKAFIPEDEDYILCDADYSQIELRILAHISGDGNLISDFGNNLDIHAATASKVFNIPIGSVTQAMRSRAKAVNFGIIYGIGDYSLSRDLGISRREAREYIDSYLETYSGVRSYMKEIISRARQDGYVTTLMNRRRYIPEIKSSNFATRSFGERIALNTPIQGTAADIIKIAMVSVFNEIKARGLKSRMILQVHDELLIETYIHELDEVKVLLKTAMENAIPMKVPLIADIRVGANWFEAK